MSLSSFALSLLLSLLLTWVVRNRALKNGWVSLPQSERHVHTVPLPRIGGVAIFGALVISLTAVLYYMGRHPVRQAFHMRTMAFLLVPGTIVFLLGLYDDIRGIGPYWKFAIQGVAAAIVFAGGLRIMSLPLLFGSSQFGWLASLAITIVWILWITNAFNLIDGVDGLATGSALFSTFVVLIVSALNGNQFGLLLTATLSGALIGFLRFNFNPATIFLGDCGSLFVGFMLGSLALYGQKSPTMVAVAIPVVSFGLPILETMVSVVRRFMNGKPLFAADREHIHHKLLKRFTPRQTTLILYAVSAMFGLLSLFLLLPGGGPVALVLVVLGGIVWVGAQHLGYQEVFELRRVAQRTFDQKQVIVNNLAVRRAVASFAESRSVEAVRLELESAFAENEFDGYELEYVPASATGHAPEIRMAWCKPHAIEILGKSAVWRMDLALASDDRGHGHFRVYREYSERPLMLDINLLTHYFPGELAQALDRAHAAEITAEEALDAAAGQQPLRPYQSQA
ncbi:MAG: undecaprenyl/decaprenyl-phosphate alpha-N-acetylglucosaminyl 1-phosphate transferase [Acidobacteriia bacterium]|nr:undecaprenyl/decaprenyl-phosphate alpha-N-acetylglucosaminyl 1-phosphate transferase [Terriglobia bacterium]